MLDVAKPATSKPRIPFDTAQLDRLMDQAGIDVLLVNSKHNVQYLLGGHRSIFFDYMDAMGISRYLPILVYAKGAPDKAAFFGHRLETHQREVTPSGRRREYQFRGLDRCHAEGGRAHPQVGVKAKRLGVEMAFLPADAAAALKSGFPDSEVKDGLFVLERLRAKKRPEELDMLRKSSEPSSIP